MQTFEKYDKIKIESSDQKILDGLLNNRDIVFLRQDKGRGVVILDRAKYIEKSEAFLNGRQFKQLNEVPLNLFNQRCSARF